jgi:hypothetical protein
VRRSAQSGSIDWQQVAYEFGGCVHDLDLERSERAIAEQVGPHVDS